MKKLVMLACVAFLFAGEAAEKKSDGGKDSRIWLPIGLSILTPPIQLPSPSHTVFGAMLNLGYGQMDNLAILDLGLINNVTDSMVGLELGALSVKGGIFENHSGGYYFSKDYPRCRCLIRRRWCRRSASSWEF